MTGSELDRIGGLALPSGPDELEGWTLEDLDQWATTVGVAIDAHERLLEQFRLGVGLVLWKIRTLEPDGSYGIRVERMAEVTGMSTRTLSGWRRDAEDHYGLPAPDARTVGRREQIRRDAETASPPAAPKGEPERVRPSEVLPPPPDPVTRPAASASHTASRGPRHEQLALPLEQASSTIEQVSIDELAALPLARLKGMQARIAQALAIASKACRPTTTGAVGPHRPTTPGAGSEGCAHQKSMLTVLPYLTRCDPEKGGCGAKVR